MICGQTCDELYHFTFYWSSYDTLRIPTDQVSLSQTLRCPGQAMGAGVLRSAANQDWYLPVPTYGSTWVVLWLLFCRSAPSTFPVTWSTLTGPFRGVPSLRSYSKIDHIHLSSEAQCVSHHLPQVDCHRIIVFQINGCTNNKWLRATYNFLFKSMAHVIMTHNSLTEDIELSGKSLSLQRYRENAICLGAKCLFFSIERVSDREGGVKTSIFTM